MYNNCDTQWLRTSSMGIFWFVFCYVCNDFAADFYLHKIYGKATNNFVFHNEEWQNCSCVCLGGGQCKDIWENEKYFGRANFLSDQYIKYVCIANFLDQYKMSLLCEFFGPMQKYPPLLQTQPTPRCRKIEALHLPLFLLQTNQWLQTISFFNEKLMLPTFKQILVSKSRTLWRKIVCL